jgi:hypothetical protein
VHEDWNIINSTSLLELKKIYILFPVCYGFLVLQDVVYSFEQSLNSILHPPFLVFVTQVSICKLVMICNGKYKKEKGACGPLIIV